MSATMLQKIEKNNYIIQQILPNYSLDTSTCEYESYRKKCNISI